MSSPITENRRGRGPAPGLTVGIVLLLCAVGLGVFGVFFAPALLGVMRARSWQPTECTILSSGVRVHLDSDGDTYSLELSYRYLVDGAAHEGRRHQFLGGSSSDWQGRQALSLALSPGTTVPCYYDPAHPAQVVIERGLTAGMLAGLVPLAFVLVGLGLLRGMRPAGEAEATAQRLEPGRTLVAGPRRRATRLLPTSSRRGKLFLTLFFALVWNGVISLFVVRAYADRSVFLSLFLVPFVAVGVGAVLGVVHAFLGLFNPVVELTLGQEALQVGGAAEVGWRVQGRVERFRTLELRLEGEEVATYQQGTETKTERRVFSRRVIGAGRRLEELRSGRAPLHVPAGSMHSFCAPHNKIEWRLVVHGDIPAWPDVSESYAITVLPGAPAVEVTYREAARPSAARFACVGDDALRILVTDGERGFRPGDTVTGMVAWLGLPSSASSSALELRLFWHTRGKGTEDVHIVERLRVERAGSRGQESYAFRLPTGPHSCSGQLVSLLWGLEVVVEGTALSARGELVVGPDGQEILIDGAAGDGSA